jgi:hypothetical protein
MSVTTATTTFASKIPDAPLLFFQPFNMLVFFAFYSPFVIAVVTVSLSFLFQNFKGLIYLLFLIFASTVRGYFIGLKGGDVMNGSNKQTADICTSIQFTRHGNQTYSCFVFAITIMYMVIPMFANTEVNFFVFIGLIMYGIFDIAIRKYTLCIGPDLNKNIIFDVLSGAFLSTVFVIGVIQSGNSKFLFFNETSSSKEVCTKPSSETFKCSVYKNGELLGSATP